MKTKKLNVTGFDPRIWIRSIGKNIPYLGSEAKSLKAHNDRIMAEAADKEPKKTGILEKIRSAHYGQTQFPGKETTGTPAAVTLESKVEIPIKKVPVSENVVKHGNTFLENMQSVAEEYLGAEHENTEFDIGPDGNITREDWTFEQNLDAMQRALNGKGTGAGKVVTENVAKDDVSFEENLAAVTNAFLGKGPEKLEAVNDNVTDPDKSLLENLDAIAENFPGITVRQMPDIIGVEKPVAKRKIKGIHY